MIRHNIRYAHNICWHIFQMLELYISLLEELTVVTRMVPAKVTLL